MRRNQFRLRVNWGDTDKAGIVYYPNYFKWFDIAGHQFFRSIDLSPSTLSEREGVILPLLDVRCSFEKPLYYDDVITVMTEVAEVNAKTIKLTHQVFARDVRTGYGYELRGWVREMNGSIKAMEIPAAYRAVLEEDRPFPPLNSDPWLCS